MIYVLIRYLHFSAIFVLVGALIIENMALKPLLNAEDARNLARVDAVFSGSVLLVFLFGLILWLWVGKPSEFYSSNPLFQIKLALFFLISLFSIYPTIFFIRNRKSVASSICVPKAVAGLIKLELVILLIIPVLAFLMARGIGLDT